MKILYKIVHSLLLLAIIPILLFLPLVRFIMVLSLSSSSGLGLLGGLIGNAIDVNKIVSNAIGYDLSTLPEYWRILDIRSFFFGENAKIKTEGFDLSAIPETVTGPVRAAIILLIVAVAFAVIALITGLIVNKRKWIAAIPSLLGVGCAVGANALFSKGAELLVSGRVSVQSILQNVPALEQYKTYLEFLKVDIRIFDLSSAYTMLLLVLAAAAVFSVIMTIVEYVSD